MKRTIALLIMTVAVVLFVFADSHLGRTESNLSDDSFVVQAYYKGTTSTSTNNSVTLAFKDYSNQTIVHSSQNSQGTTVNVSNNHLGADGTIFTWSMTGSTNKTVTLKFTFSVLQAEVNGMFYRPTYTLKMTINPTKKDNSSGSAMDDTFYSNATATQIVGGGTTTGTKASQTSEFTGGSTINYSGIADNSYSSGWFGNTSYYTWYRSGTCTLNISDYEQAIPGAYEYRCWIVTEVTVQ